MTLEHVLYAFRNKIETEIITNDMIYVLNDEKDNFNDMEEIDRPYEYDGPHDKSSYIRLWPKWEEDDIYVNPGRPN